ncbi:hypothetical protein PISMIDRAFT_456463 [Pisolithus microcarpus 441]|uniref:Uncharacterized protein n=1 Tax=Pisolithus microcarpus 441 TaxID=765257 RepID=A0A0C9ZCB7_9AGAM|nr:hypothetical protein PISMIDRAFT_456463 [Pisolithus microcarpus 441]
MPRASYYQLQCRIQIALKAIEATCSFQSPSTTLIAYSKRSALARAAYNSHFQKHTFGKGTRNSAKKQVASYPALSLCRI